MNTLDVVAAVIREQFSFDGIVGCDTVADDVDGWDSLSHAFLIMELEARFGVELPIEALGNLQNVGDLVDALDSVR